MRANLLRLLAGALSGLLWAASYPPIDLSVLAWVALIPLLVALRGASPRVAFATGVATWCAFWPIYLGWALTLDGVGLRHLGSRDPSPRRRPSACWGCCSRASPRGHPPGLLRHPLRRGSLVRSSASWSASQRSLGAGRRVAVRLSRRSIQAGGAHGDSGPLLPRGVGERRTGRGDLPARDGPRLVAAARVAGDHDREADSCWPANRMRPSLRVALVQGGVYTRGSAIRRRSVWRCGSATCASRARCRPSVPS